MPEEIDHGGGHDAVHVEDEVGLLARGDGLDVQRVARDGPGGPARRHVGLELAHAGVRVVDGLHSGGAALVLSGGVENRMATLARIKQFNTFWWEIESFFGYKFLI